VFYEEGNISSFSTLSRLIKEDSTFKLEYMWTGEFRLEDDPKETIKGITSIRCIDASKLSGGYWSNAEQNPKHGKLEFEKETFTKHKKKILDKKGSR
jgi:hypothetical protein